MGVDVTGPQLLRVLVLATVLVFWIAGPAGAQADRDGDGLDDAEERRLGTDPELGDTDGDGLRDGVEVALGMDPSSSDSDGDGVSDTTEYLAGSDPRDPAATPSGVAGTSAPTAPPAALPFDDAGEETSAAWWIVGVGGAGLAVFSAQTVRRRRAPTDS